MGRRIALVVLVAVAAACSSGERARARRPTAPSTATTSTTSSTTSTVPPVAVAVAPATTMAPASSLQPRYESFVSATVAWVASNANVVLTTDAGAHWRDVTPAHVCGDTTGLYAFDARHAGIGVAGGSCSDSVLWTSNAGAHWVASRLPAVGGDTQYFSFVSPTVGWDELSQGAAMGSESVSILRTVDGGAHWRLMSNSGSLDLTKPATPGALDAGCDKTGITFVDAAIGFATLACAGGSPEMAVTDDRGRTWRRVLLPRPAVCPDGCGFEMPPPRRTRGGLVAWASLFDPSPFNLVSVSRNGAAWRSVVLPHADVHWADALDASTWWVAAGTWLLITNDGGAHWHGERPRLPAEIDVLHVVSSDAAWAVFGVGSGPGLARTADGGRTWRVVAL